MTGAQLRRVLQGLGAVLFVVGIYLGFSPMTVAALDGTLNCGSAFSPNQNFLAGDLVRAECESKRNDRSTLATALIIAGLGVAGVATWRTWPDGSAGRRDEDEGDKERSDPAPTVTP